MKPGYQIQTLCARVPQTPQSRGKEKTREKKKKRIKKNKCGNAMQCFEFHLAKFREGGREAKMQQCLYDERRRAASKSMTDSSERAMATKWAWYISASAAF
jgi:hypothetical protein